LSRSVPIKKEFKIPAIKKARARTLTSEGEKLFGSVNEDITPEIAL
jgi:hypothetical protein